MDESRTKAFVRTGGLVGIASGVAILLSSLSTFITSSIAIPDGPSDLTEYFTDVDTFGYGLQRHAGEKD